MRVAAPLAGLPGPPAPRNLKRERGEGHEDFALQNQRDNDINGSFTYKGPRNSVKGCRIQFFWHLICWKLSCSPGSLRALLVLVGEEGCSAAASLWSLLTLCCCSFFSLPLSPHPAGSPHPPTHPLSRKPPWQAKHKPTPLQHYFSPKGPGGLHKPCPKAPEHGLRRGSVVGWHP